MTKPHQPELTIGVPVHNGAAHIVECLENLARQTHRDFEVIIFENMSDDSTKALVEAFCQSDPRFSVQSSSTFLSMFDNFMRAFNGVSGRGRFFALRAYDDQTSNSYFEKLCETLRDDPDKDLAVGRVQYLAGETCTDARFERTILDRAKWGTFARPFNKINFPASWFYGVYRAQGAHRIFEALTAYPNMWAGDRLIVLSYLFEGKLAFVEDAVFRCRQGSASYEKYAEKGVWNKLRARKKYFDYIWAFRDGLRMQPRFSSLAFFTLCYKTSASDTAHSIERIVKELLRRRPA